MIFEVIIDLECNKKNNTKHDVADHEIEIFYRDGEEAMTKPYIYGNGRACR